MQQDQGEKDRYGIFAKMLIGPITLVKAVATLSIKYSHAYGSLVGDRIIFSVALLDNKQLLCAKLSDRFIIYQLKHVMEVR
jgi:hypothetical protein